MEKTIRLTAMTAASGCAAKIGPGALQDILAGLKTVQQSGRGGSLIVGFDSMDDAAVFRMDNGTLLVQTLDFFTPVVDDPYMYGQIAAANALSDVYAMGGQPLMAANILCFPPCTLDAHTVAEILRGGQEKVTEAGAVLTGGHSIDDAVPKYGLSVIGIVGEGELTANSGGKPGDLLYLSKPLGTGVLLTAFKGDLAAERDIETCLQSMCTLNAAAAGIARRLQLTAATDITGFGLVGHVHELGEASGVSAELYADALPFYAGALEYARQGILPAGLYRNREYLAASTTLSGGVKQMLADLIFDPQTSGGLLLCVPPERQDEVQRELVQLNMPAQCIGSLTVGEPGQVRVYADKREAEIWR